MIQVTKITTSTYIEWDDLPKSEFTNKAKNQINMQIETNRHAHDVTLYDDIRHFIDPVITNSWWTFKLITAYPDYPLEYHIIVDDNKDYQKLMDHLMKHKLTTIRE